jgi:hypothetical protein
MLALGTTLIREQQRTFLVVTSVASQLASSSRTIATISGVALSGYSSGLKRGE